MSRLTLEEIISKPRANYKVIPLGTGCYLANYLMFYDLRTEAFPFDWNITPMQSVKKLLDNDFDDFLCRDNLYFGTQRQVPQFFLLGLIRLIMSGLIYQSPANSLHLSPVKNTTCCSFMIFLIPPKKHIKKLLLNITEELSD